MSMEVTEVHYDPDPKHIIIRSDTSTVDCSNPVPATEWLDGTYGERVCIYSNQYMHFQKALCDSVVLDDTLLFFTFQRTPCVACGVLNALTCCLNTTPLNSWAVKDSADNCLTV